MPDSTQSPPSAAVDVERYRVRAGSPVRLADWDPRATDGFDGEKNHGKDVLDTLTKRLEELQEILYAQGRHKVLIVLQAMDTGGKDGVIRHVFEGVNPSGVRVASFKVPTSVELAHDYLWRVHQHTPGKGEIVIFNRSHYEDVLVVRVHSLVDAAVWGRRYDHIRAFEQMLADEGTTILKFFLHISPDEQKARLQARLDNPSKHWKFAVGDLAERKRWAEYIAAYEDVLQRTSSEVAPWYIVPADRKWYRDLVVSQTIVNTLEGLGLAYPDAEPGLDAVVIE